jgi:hypothetical protein
VNTERIVVPDGMRVAVAHAVFDAVGTCDYHPQIRIALEAALLWLSEHPIVPSDAQWIELVAQWKRDNHPMDTPSMEDIYPLWQHRMFLVEGGGAASGPTAGG